MCKDVSTAGNNNVYRICVNTNDGYGLEFFGKPANLQTDEERRLKVAAQVECMTRFNAYVEAVLERTNGNYVIRDTTLKV